MPEFEDMDELVSHVHENHGIATFRMDEVRNAFGRSRLGENVREDIADELRSRRMLFYPRRIPGSQWEYLRIYARDSRVAEIINAVLSAGAQGDAVIRETATDQASELLRRVREIVALAPVE